MQTEWSAENPVRLPRFVPLRLYLAARHIVLFFGLGLLGYSKAPASELRGQKKSTPAQSRNGGACGQRKLRRA